MDTAKIQTLRDDTTGEAIAPRTHLLALTAEGKKGQVVGFTEDNKLGVMNADLSAAGGEGSAPAEHDHNDLYYTKEEADEFHRQMKEELEGTVDSKVSELEGKIDGKLSDMKQEIEDEIKEGGGFTKIHLGLPTGINITNTDEGCTIKWTDPEDVVIPGSSGILAKWKGTIVIRKPGSAPKDQKDGTVVATSTVRDQYKTNGLADSGLTNGTKYYYGIFPYSTDEVYTTESITEFTPSAILPPPATGITITNMDEAAVVKFTNPQYPDYPNVQIVYKAGSTPASSDDGGFLKFLCSSKDDNNAIIKDLKNDKEYHFVVYTFNAKRECASTAVKFTPTAIYPQKPDKVSIENGILSAKISFTASPDAISHKIVYKAGSAPTSPEDGTSVDASTSPVTISGLVAGTTYHFRVYAFNSKRYTASDAVYVTAREAEVYAFHVNQATESNPASMVTYPAGCDNAAFAPAKMGASAFDYGGWANAFFIKKLKVVMLSTAGVELYEIDPNNYGQKKAGGAITATDGNVMVAFPKVYFKTVLDSNGKDFTVYVSDVKLDDEYVCYAHIDKDGNELDYCYVGAYDGYLNGSSVIKCQTGQTPMVSKTAQNEIDWAQANGDGWYTGVMADLQMINRLLTLIGKSTNQQATFGNGVCNASAKINTGTLDTKGLFWGDISGKTSAVKVFGIENFYGNIYKRIAGWMCVSGKQLIKLTWGTQDGSTGTGYNQTGAGYIDAGCPSTGTNGGYIKEMKASKHGLIPVYGSTGSETTYWCDSAWIYNNGTYYAFVGGAWSNGGIVGGFCVDLNCAPSSADTSIGASLSFKKKV